MDPETPDEWRDAVEWAEVMLLLDSARGYGVVTGGPAVDVERCLELQARGRALGHAPTTRGTEARIPTLLGSYMKWRRRPSGSR
jgi:hypothetical protein